MGDDLTRRPGWILDDARREGVATVLISCRCNPSLICHCSPPRPNEETPRPEAQPPRLDHPSSGTVARQQQTRSRSRRAAAATDPFGKLPPELLPTILSQLDGKQAARTSLLSRAWRHAWKLSPKLTLDIVAICGDGYGSCKSGEEQYLAYVNRGRDVQRFIDTIDTILGLRSGSVVEELDLRFCDQHLPQISNHLDAWIRFAVLSPAKSVKLHLWETPFALYGRDRYELPLQLLDVGGGVSILQHIHLSSVSLKVPSSTQSIGFPNLKNLGLHFVPVSTSDLQHMLSNSPNLERLDLNMVYLGDQLTMHRPLTRLLCLRLVDCGLTRIELVANMLRTFICRGHFVPTTINLGETPGLCNVNIQCFKLTLQDAVSTLPDAFHMVRRLSLSCTCVPPTVPSPLGNTSRFSRLRYLQLLFCIYPEHSDVVLSIAYFLESAPLLEELDIKFVSASKNGGEGPLRRLAQGESEYKRLKSLRAREFTGQKDQLALMIHIVENAPALEILTIDPIREHVPASIDRITEAGTRSLSDIRGRATTFIAEKLLVKTKFIVE